MTDYEKVGLILMLASLLTDVPVGSLWPKMFLLIVFFVGTMLFLHGSEKRD